MNIFKRSRLACAALVTAALTLSLLTASRAAFNLGDLLKVGGIGYVVTRFDKPINSFINKSLGERRAEARGATKVVPILSLGGGGYVGAAQVVGAARQVQQTKFVVQVESRLFGSLHARVLIPTGARPTGGSVQRMTGVGVSAVVEFKI